MNQLIAKIRDRSRTNNKLRKVISDEIMFVLPENLDEAIGYDPSTLLEDEEWYVIQTEFVSNMDSLPLIHTPAVNQKASPPGNTVPPPRGRVGSFH